jgi:iron complex transport system ATP-binding protein
MINDERRTQAGVFAKDISFNAGGARILRGVTLEARAGEFTALIGPNGCGKTTLLKTICRLHKPAGGAVYIGGENVQDMSARGAARKMAALAQENGVCFDLPVIEVVLASRYARKKLFEDYGGADYAACEAALALAGLSNLRERGFQSLSGGEKQRVLLAAAFAQDAPVILLDEPANHLDAGYQFLIMDILTRRKQTEGTAVFASMHDINIAARYADRVIAMKDGLVIASGAPRDVITAGLLRELFHVKADIELCAESGRPRVTFLGAAEEAAPCTE